MDTCDYSISTDLPSYSLLPITHFQTIYQPRVPNYDIAVGQ